MARDILSIAQLEAQAERRKSRLEYLIKTEAPEAAIRTAEKDLKLTMRRLERAKNADYDEEMQSLQQMGE